MEQVSEIDSVGLEQSEPLHWALAKELYSRTEGTYSFRHFVTRLHPELNAVLQSVPSGFVNSSSVTPKILYAHSTYLHETIHWWQHVGSTTGFMLSLGQASRCHRNHPHLLRIIEELGPKKSLRTLAERDQNHLPKPARDRLNTIVNNFHDVELNTHFILDPSSLERLAKNPFFESVGHSLELGLECSLWLLHITFDAEFAFLPDFRPWEAAFDDLRDRKVENYHRDSRILRPPVGARDIFEGQARFSQFQYLHLAIPGSPTWDEFKKWGMMGDEYLWAFEQFILLAELEWPSSPIDPIVHLFLLVCDIAINPSDGYPFKLRHYESFRESVDPGFRFYLLARHIAQNPSLKTAIQECSRKEYEEVSRELCKVPVCRTPVEVAEEIASWVPRAQVLQDLLNEEATYAYRKENLVARLYFAKHLRYAQDRAKFPEFFCWPGMHMAGEGFTQTSPETTDTLWRRHSAPFFAELGGEVQPTLVKGLIKEQVQESFNGFYSGIVQYDLLDQWTMTDGAFTFDYKWLAPQHPQEDMTAWCSEGFKMNFGVAPQDFELL
jgi:hypothetical protein